MDNQTGTAVDLPSNTAEWPTGRRLKWAGHGWPQQQPYTFWTLCVKRV